MSPDLKLAIHYGLRRRKLALANAVVLLLAAAFESIGVGMLIPLFESIGGGAPSNIFARMFASAFAMLGINYNFVNLILVFGVIMLLKYAFVAMQQRLSRMLSSSLAVDLMTSGFAGLMRVPLSFYYRRQLGDMVATAFTSARLAGGMIEHFIILARAVLFTTVYVVLGCMISLQFTTLLSILAAISYIFIMPRFQVGYSKAAEEKRILDDMHSFLYDTLAGIRIVKAFHRESDHQKSFETVTDDFRKVLINLGDNSILTSFLFEPFIFILLVILMIMGVTVFHLPISSLMVLLFVFVQLAPQIKLVNSAYLQVQEFMPHFSKINELISLRDEFPSEDGRIALPSFSRDIQFEKVSFSYPGARDSAVNGISFRIEKNSTVALVGESGGGKSTLLDLLMRFHDPAAGTIRIDGIDVRDIRIEDLRKLITIVDQDPYLFNRSIRENILYGNPGATEAELLECARLAHAHEFILSFPDGYDTIVGTRGMNLSGGQRQRLAMARALIKNSSILLMDESTSSLDAESERFIHDSLRTLQHQKTIIIIAHRLSTIANADKIFLIEKGQLVECGSHQELLALNGRYRHYHDLQFAQLSALPGSRS